MFSQIATKNLGSRLVVLGLIVLVVSVLIALVGTLLFQTDIRCASIAVITCLVASLLAHVAGEYPKGNELIVARMAIQMVVRSALPFVVAVWGIYFCDPPLGKSLVFYMIVFYLVGLIAEVQLSLSRLKGSVSSSV
ncbi:MAG: hypothetical protein ACI87E_000494 [Mariniblastus sp.]|jgi:hypothetical protein